METPSELILIQLDQNMQHIRKYSIQKPISYESLKQFIINNFKISSFIMYYFDQNNKEVNITNNEDFCR